MEMHSIRCGQIIKFDGSENEPQFPHMRTFFSGMFEHSLVRAASMGWKTMQINCAGTVTGGRVWMLD